MEVRESWEWNCVICSGGRVGVGVRLGVGLDWS